MARVVRARRPRRDPRDHDADASRRCRASSGCGSTASCRCSAASPATRPPTATCRTRSSASPARRARRGADGGCGLRAIRWVLTAGGIIALHVGDGRRDRGRAADAVDAVARASAGAPHARALMARSRRACVELAARPGRRSATTRATRSPPAASACARCWCSSPPAGGPRTPTRRWSRAAAAVELDPLRDARPRRRARRRGAAARRARPSSPRPAATPRPRPATCCSRARSPSLRASGARRAGARARRRPLGASRRGELLQRADAWDADVTLERYLRAASSRPRACSRRVRARRAGAAADDATRALGAVRPRRSGSPSSSSTTSSTSPGRPSAPASARHRPARRDRHAAADPRARARPRAARRSTCARSPRRSAAAEVCERIAATGALRAPASARSSSSTPPRPGFPPPGRRAPARAGARRRRGRHTLCLTAVRLPYR